MLSPLLQAKRRSNDGRTSPNRAYLFRASPELAEEMDRKVSMGNLKEKTFDKIWNSDRANEIRKIVSNCDKGCWMIGSVSSAMKKDFRKVTKWILGHKFLGKD